MSAERSLPDATAPRRRLLVALDATEDIRALIEMAAEMAARMQADLAGLFVEDTDLLGLGDNPLVRMVSASRGVSQPLGRGTIEHAMRRQIAEARALFERIAESHRLSATFEVRRGRLTTALETVAASDIILVRRGVFGLHQAATSHRQRVNAATRQVVASARQPVIVLDVRTGAARGAMGPVVTLYDGGAATEQALIAAAEIADRRYGDGIVVLPLAASEEEARDLGERASAILAPLGHRPRIGERATPDFVALCATCTAQDKGVLVLHADHELLKGDGLARLLDDIACSVMVVR